MVVAEYQGIQSRELIRSVFIRYLVCFMNLYVAMFRYINHDYAIFYNMLSCYSYQVIILSSNKYQVQLIVSSVKLKSMA